MQRTVKLAASHTLKPLPAVLLLDNSIFYFARFFSPILVITNFALKNKPHAFFEPRFIIRSE